MPRYVDRLGGGKCESRIVDGGVDFSPEDVRCIETVPGKYDKPLHFLTFVVLPKDSGSYWRLDVRGNAQALRYWKYEIRKSISQSIKNYYNPEN